MPALAPFRLSLQFHERPWGARDLAPIYACRRAASQAPIGEVWLTGDDCRAATGAERGLALAELAQRFGAQLTGEAALMPHRFPLLIKFLFPREKLSVQVHPDDAAARAAGQPCGKTECWYVLAAEKGAQVALGLKPGTTRAALRAAVEQGRAEDMLNWIQVRAGEMLYAEAGTVHAIGPGSILVETQQNSDTTYRLYDYGRGRPLHLEQGLAAAKERTQAGRVVREPERALPPAEAIARGAGADNCNLVTAACFVVDRHLLQARNQQVITRHMPPSSVQVLVALAGRGAVRAPASEPVKFERGEAVVVPAGARTFSVEAEERLEFLRMSLPQQTAGHPRTTMH